MWAIARALPPAAAASTGSFLLGALGPHLRKQRQVLRNLRQVLPGAAPEELHRAARGVWRNLGAVLFEYPHLERIVDERIQVTMPPEVRALFDEGLPMLFMSAHLANWEVLGSFLARHGSGVVGVYGPNDNPVIDRMIQRFRARSGVEYVTKAEALRRLTAKHLKGRSVGLLADVRVDSAPCLPLFGAGAPTTISPARMAARLEYPMVPVRVRRTDPARYLIEFETPLPPAPAHMGKRGAVDAMRRYNERLEDWISERPEEWLCTKRRWPRVP